MKEYCVICPILPLTYFLNHWLCYPIIIIYNNAFIVTPKMLGLIKKGNGTEKSGRRFPQAASGVPMSPTKEASHKEWLFAHMGKEGLPILCRYQGVAHCPTSTEKLPVWGGEMASTRLSQSHKASVPLKPRGSPFLCLSVYLLYVPDDNL